jgi:amino acid adenylation domain-containing protein
MIEPVDGVGAACAEADNRAPDGIVSQDPVSFAQQRLWLLHHLGDGTSAYTTSNVYALDGPLDLRALQAGVDALVQRHESLRSRFVIDGGELLQQVMSSQPVVVAVQDDATEDDARQRAREEAARAFDLATGPLLRVAVARLGADHHWLILTLHHIATDRWSQGVLIRELSAFYAAARGGRSAVLDDLPVQYADYAIWQREWLRGEVLDAQVGYWRDALAGLPTLDVPTDRPRPPIASYRGERLHFEVPRDVAAALRDLARREGATLFMALLAAYEVLLHRHSGQDDFGVGVPIAGRSRPELEGLIGFFVNTLVMRAELSGRPTMRELLQRVKATALDAYAHQDVPFEKLVEELAPRRDPSRNPLFQASFAFQNVPRGAWSLPGIVARRVDDAVGHGAKFDLDLAMHDGDDGALVGTLDYCSDLFERATVDGLVHQWQALLRGVAAQPDERIDRLPLMDAATRAKVERLGHGPPLDVPDASVATLIRAAALREPGAVAMDTGHRQILYHELDAQVARLAHHLRTRGVRDATRVAVCLPPSADLVACLLAVQALGATYVPLDPAHPAPRLRAIIVDADAALVVTTRALNDRLGTSGIPAACLDEEQAAIAAYPATLPDARVMPDTIAYIAYTSGSTGVPKGVMVEQRSLVNYLAWIQQALPLSAGDRMLVKTSIGFDASLEEILYPLAAGATLVIPQSPERLLADFAGVVARERISVIQVVPSVLAAWLDAADPDQTSSVRLVLCGAEALAPSLLARAAQRLAARIVNLYGPTETTISSTMHVCDARADADAVPIGRPIANTFVSVRDAHGELVPTGVAGELWIGGAGVARGTTDAGAAEERFVVRADGARLYRTGDRMRMRADGVLLFLGRCDDQVKIRGVRIEPADVRAALVVHPDVAECEVVLDRCRPDGPVLKAFVALRDGARRDDAAARLRGFLAERLPAPMVPAAYALLDALPRHASGKVDRAALMVGDAVTLAPAAYAAPGDAIESTLCRLWAEVLDAPRVGVDDDFFDLGGHSLLAARLFARQDEALKVAVPMSALFAAPTVRSLARRYRGGDATAPPGDTVFALTKSETGARIFAVPGIEGDVIGYADLVRVLGDAHRFYGLQSVGLDGRRSPLDTIEAIAAAHLVHIRAIQPHGPYVFLGACFGATVAYEMARQVLAHGEDVALLGLLNLTMRPARADGRVRTLPRPVRRLQDALLFCAERIALYRDEMRDLGILQRMRYLAAKARGTSGTVLRSVASGTPLREMHRKAVTRANAAAMDRYVRAPLPRSPTEVMALVAGRHGGPEVRAEIARLAGAAARVLHQAVPGRDTGDMLADGHAAFVAVHLRAALERIPRAASEAVRSAGIVRDPA